MRTSNIRVESRETEAGRRLAAAVFPSGRLALHDRGTIVMYPTEERCPADRPDHKKPPNVRTGVLYRKEDESGVSGTGIVADFVRFADGTVVQEWRNEDNPKLATPDGAASSGLDLRPSMRMAVAIHGHEGRTEYVYDNGEVAQG